jgi:MFS family permease
VVVLGAVSFLTDVSSEMLFAALPLFLTSVLGATPAVLGLMEGLADFSASSLDLFSGYFSDRVGKRKPIAAGGYALSTLAKGLLPFARAAPEVVLFRVVDRFGKSIRGVPRDALLAAVAPASRRGKAFGLHKALDRAGAMVGPLWTYWVLSRFGHSRSAFQHLFASALVPGFAAVLVLVLFVKERPAPTKPRAPLVETLRRLDPKCRHFFASSAIFSAAYFSWAFLLLAASRVGFPAEQVALLYVLYNASASLFAAPVGMLSDRLGRRTLIAASFALYAFLSAGLAIADSREAVVPLFVLYGIFLAIDEGQSRAYIADLVPDTARATALGAYGLVTGIVYFPASLVAGLAWTRFGPRFAFGAAAALAVAALAHFLLGGPSKPARALARS